MELKNLYFRYNLDSVDIKKGQKVFYKGENIGEVTTIRTIRPNRGFKLQREINFKEDRLHAPVR